MKLNILYIIAKGLEKCYKVSKNDRNEKSLRIPKADSKKKKSKNGNTGGVKPRKPMSIFWDAVLQSCRNVIKFVLKKKEKKKVFITFLKLIFLPEDGVMNVNRVERINQ